VKIWIEKNAKQDPSTRQIIPGQILRPDGNTIFVVRSPDDDVQIFQLCLGCSSTRESSNFEPHKCSRAYSGGASTALGTWSSSSGWGGD